MFQTIKTQIRLLWFRSLFKYRQNHYINKWGRKFHDSRMYGLYLEAMGETDEIIINNSRWVECLSRFNEYCRIAKIDAKERLKTLEK